MLSKTTHLPQTRHKEFQSDSENGGFLRISAGREFVANSTSFNYIFSE